MIIQQRQGTDLWWYEYTGELDSIAVSVFIDIFFESDNSKQIQITIWWWDEQACLQWIADKILRAVDCNYETDIHSDITKYGHMGGRQLHVQTEPKHNSYLIS